MIFIFLMLLLFCMLKENFAGESSLLPTKCACCQRRKIFSKMIFHNSTSPSSCSFFLRLLLSKRLECIRSSLHSLCIFWECLLLIFYFSWPVLITANLLKPFHDIRYSLSWNFKRQSKFSLLHTYRV